MNNILLNLLKKTRIVRPFTYLIFFFLIIGCKKNEIDIKSKDYNQSSYDLRRSDLWVDCSKIYGELPQNTFNNNSIIADFNLDGYDDILMTFTNYTETRFPIKIYYNDGSNQNFTTKNNDIKNNIGVMNARKGIVGDYNRDNKPDVIFAESGVDAPPFTGTYQSILISGENGYEYKFLSDVIWFGHGVCSADFDNDGDLDVYFTTPSEKLCLLVNKGNGIFINQPEKLIFPSYGVATCEMKDLNKDGFIDLIIGGHTFLDDPNNHPARIFWGNGVDFTEARSIQIPGIEGWDVIVDFNFADIDNDGVSEIIINRTGDPKIGYYNGFRIQIIKTIDFKRYYDITTKVITDFTSTNIEWFPWLRTEDIDKNGLLDIFNTDKGNNNTRTILHWEMNSNGIFARK